MKLSIVMKTPDALDRAVKDALLDENHTLANYELDDAAFAIKEACAEWFRCGEAVMLEIDTDTGTCVVVSNKR